MEARMPVEIIIDCKATINNFMDKKKITLKQMQSLIGKLHFACSTIAPARTFPRRCINMTMGINKIYGSTITSYVFALSFWLKLLHDNDTTNCFLVQRVLLGITNPGQQMMADYLLQSLFYTVLLMHYHILYHVRMQKQCLNLCFYCLIMVC